MRFTLTILEEDYLLLRQTLLAQAPKEGAGYILCGESRTEGEVRLLATQLRFVAPEDYLVREPDRLSIQSQSYASVAKLARDEGMAVMFVHSHPSWAGTPSFADDVEEPKLAGFLTSRIPGKHHGCMVLGNSPEASARVWVDGRWAHVDRIRILGDRYRFLDAIAGETIPSSFFDRQVRAFGPELQQLLGRLHVGIVGAGGTGSAVAEMLARLGIGEISIFDHDDLELTNVTRMLGSRTRDVGVNKALIGQRHIQDMGLGTKVHAHQGSICQESIALRLRECDLVFGCTDVEAPKAILVALALRYFIPVIDMGVKISSEEGQVRSIDGRVTTLLAGQACLFCRGRINSKRIADESLPEGDRQALIREGYAEELNTRDPAVVTFTSAVGAYAVTHMLQRFTGAIAERAYPEVILLFHLDKVLRPSNPGQDCFCRNRSLWGRGDSKPFLGLVWSDEHDPRPK